jgi:rootletin
MEGRLSSFNVNIFFQRSPSPVRSTSPRRKGFRRSRGPDKSPEKDIDEADSSAHERSLSPVRRLSPSKASEILSEIDPETVRVALRDFAQQLKDTTREKEETEARMGQLQRALTEVEEDRARIEGRLQALQKSLGDSDEGNC